MSEQFIAAQQAIPVACASILPVNLVFGSQEFFRLINSRISPQAELEPDELTECS